MKSLRTKIINALNSQNQLALVEAINSASPMEAVLAVIRIGDLADDVLKLLTKDK